MPSRPTPPAAPSHNEDDALDLPPLDDAGGDEPLAGADDDDELLAEEEGDLFDDAAAGDVVEAESLEGGVETGWLLDAEDATGLDLGPVELDLADEAGGLDDEPHGSRGEDDEIDDLEDAVTADGGEEGPLADDEVLREEDLPMLDADDDGEVDDTALFDAAGFAAADLRWDDRAWIRVEAPAADVEETDSDDSGALPVPGIDPALAARDARWRALEEAGVPTAVAWLPGGSVVLALPAPDGARARLVRILPDGEARIIAEVDPSGGREDEACEVRALSWHAEASVLVAVGNFGRQAFRPG